MQQQSFEMELGRMKENLELYEVKANTLTDEIYALKNYRARLSQNLPIAIKKLVVKNI